MNGVVIFAGGIGSRMGKTDLPKQFLDLSGKPIICRTLDVFEGSAAIDVICVVCVEEWIDHLRSLIEREGYKKIVSVVPGGDTGQESIFNGIVSLRPYLKDDDVVVMHDGVRPLIDAATVDICIRSIRERGATATVTPSTETVLYRSGAANDDVILERSRCCLARAPQGACFGDVFGAHMWARENGRNDYVDTVSLLKDYGQQIFAVEGPFENIKVTTPIDYLACVSYFNSRN